MGTVNRMRVQELMSSSLRRNCLVFLSLTLTASLVCGAGEERKRLRPLPELDRNVKTGPAIGEKIPEFEAVDQNGRTQSFASLRGPNGLMLLFVRSADW